MSFKAERQKADKTVQEVMKYMNVTDAAVYQWETGVTTPRPDKLLKLADFYGCTMEDLLRGN